MTQPPPSPKTSWAWFLDIDGTLADIALSPDAVRVDDAMQRAIAELSRACGGALALVSGRSLHDVDRLFPNVKLPAAGQHGVEHRTTAGRVFIHSNALAELQIVREALSDFVRKYPSLYLEDKGQSLALHYRAAPQLGATVHRQMQQLLAHTNGGLQLQMGKCVIEVVPVGRDKGTAVREFMKELPFANRTPVFVGDDVTDERGFSAVMELDGYAIKVGSGPTIAPYRLPNVSAVQQWLQHERLTT